MYPKRSRRWYFEVLYDLLRRLCCLGRIECFARELTVVGCCLSKVLDRTMMQEGLRGPKQLLNISANAHR